MKLAVAVVDVVDLVRGRAGGDFLLGRAAKAVIGIVDIVTIAIGHARQQAVFLRIGIAGQRAISNRCGKHVAKGIRALIIPATQKIYAQAMHEGLFDIFLNAGCVISTPTCGPCLGGHMGILAKGERAISTSNRNFVGRMGHPESEVYLASPAVAAASAIKGYIASPEEV